MTEQNKEKDILNLFDELKEENPLRKPFIDKIQETYTEINEKCRPISYAEITDNYIKNKVKTIKDKIYDKDTFYRELIPVIILANKYIFKYEPRKIQIIAVLLLLYKEKNKGLIEQIPTGEGKTVIISFLAIIKALEGKKVDIITSSLVLAERDAKLMKYFYNLFGLSVDYCRDLDHNSNNKYKNLENEFYTAEIV